MGSCPPDSKCFLLPHPTCWSQAESEHTSLPGPRGSTATISIGSTTLIKPTLSPLPGQLSTRFQPNWGKEVGDRRGLEEARTGTLGMRWPLGNCRRETQPVMTKSGPGQGQNGEEIPTLATTSEDMRMKEEAALPSFWLGIQENGSRNGQRFGHLMQTANSLEKSLMLGKIEDRRRRGCQNMRWLNGITDVMDMNLGKLQEMVRDRKAWHAAVLGVTKSRT